MTQKQFNNKIRGFIWLVKRERGVDLGEKYVKNAVYDFYGKNRYIPRLFVRGTTLGMQ